MEDKIIHITSQTLNPTSIIDGVARNSAGAVNVFIGRVRDQTKGNTVVRLEYEAYESMARSEMAKIVSASKKRWPGLESAIHHRTGTLIPGDIAVVIVACTAHRKDSFEACEYMIDTLKETVPIWKKEVFEDGEVWVSAHP